MAEVLRSSVNFSTRYRQTPFRWHVEQQMGWSDDDNNVWWERSLPDVLALDELRRRLPENELVRSVLTLEQFFYYQSNPDMVAYLPVKVAKSPARVRSCTSAASSRFWAVSACSCRACGASPGGGWSRSSLRCSPPM